MRPSMIKAIVAIALVVLMIATFIACGNKDGNQGDLTAAPGSSVKNTSTNIIIATGDNTPTISFESLFGSGSSTNPPVPSESTAATTEVQTPTTPIPTEGASETPTEASSSGSTPTDNSSLNTGSANTEEGWGALQ